MISAIDAKLNCEIAIEQAFLREIAILKANVSPAEGRDILVGALVGVVWEIDVVFPGFGLQMASLLADGYARKKL